MKINSKGKYIVSDDVFVELEKRREWNKYNDTVDWEKGHAHYMKMQMDFPQYNTVPESLRQFSPKEYALLMEKGYTTETRDKIDFLESKIYELEAELRNRG